LEDFQKLPSLTVKLSSQKQQALDDALLKLLVGKVLPLSLVDHPLFREFVQQLNPQ
jgi:hypothetical protein